MTSPLNNKELLQQLQSIFRQTLKSPNLVLEPSMKTGAHPNWDSFANVEILMNVESHWEIQFSANEIDQLRSVQDLLNVISLKTN